MSAPLPSPQAVRASGASAAPTPPSAAPTRGEELPDESHFLSGIIRSERARAKVHRFPVDGPDWSAPPPESDAGQPEAPDYAALRAAWEAEWQQQAVAECEAAVAAARAQAYAEGAAAARAELAAAREAERLAFADDAARLHALWEAHLTSLDPPLVELALDVAEAVLDGPLGEDDHATLTEAITSAVERVATQPPLVVSLHPVDHLRLEEAGLAEALSASHPGLRWVPDAGLAEGDWTLDADGVAVRRVRSEVLHDLRHRLGLDPDTSSEAAE